MCSCHQPKCGAVKTGVRWKFLLMGYVALIVGEILAKASKDPLRYMIPNFLLLTPFRSATQLAWTMVLRYDTSQERKPMRIPELRADDYSFDALRTATQNWKSPAVVRRLFEDTTAVAKWAKPGYVSSKIGQHQVDVIQVTHPEKLNNERIIRLENFNDAFNDVLKNKNSRKYLFFPLRGNKTAVSEQQRLIEEVNEMARVDLDLDRLWPGFGKHISFTGAQFIAGRGWKATSRNQNSGINLHCAIGSNWFVQVVGRKRWEFLDQEYSAFMQPQRHGLAYFSTGSRNMAQLQKYLPVKYVDLEAGDILYNPNFEWHKITNYPGVSIGAPLEEYNTTLARRNNVQYFALAVISLLMSTMGISY